MIVETPEGAPCPTCLPDRSARALLRILRDAAARDTAEGSTPSAGAIVDPPRRASTRNGQMQRNDVVNPHRSRASTRAHLIAGHLATADWWLRMAEAGIIGIDHAFQGAHRHVRLADALRVRSRRGRR